MKTKIFIFSFILIFSISCSDDTNNVMGETDVTTESTDISETTEITKEEEDEEEKDIFIFPVDFKDLRTMIYDLNSIIDPIIKEIPESIKSEFELKYKIWEETFPRYEVQSNPWMYGRSEEYYNLFNYCKFYGNAIWPLIFKKSVREVICSNFDDEEMLSISGWEGPPSRYWGFSCVLLSDLGDPEYGERFLASIQNVSNSYDIYYTSFYSSYYIAVVEKDNILQAIQDLREAENVAEE